MLGSQSAAPSSQVPASLWYREHRLYQACLQILQAPYQSPVNVSTALTLPFSPHDSDLLAFGESTAPGPETVYLRAPLGLLNIDTGVPMPRSHLTAVNVRPPTCTCWLPPAPQPSCCAWSCLAGAEHVS